MILLLFAKKYYITILLKELGYPDGTSNTYKLNLSDLQQIKADNIEFVNILITKFQRKKRHFQSFIGSLRCINHLLDKDLLLHPNYVLLKTF